MVRKVLNERKINDRCLSFFATPNSFLITGYLHTEMQTVSFCRKENEKKSFGEIEVSRSPAVLNSFSSSSNEFNLKSSLHVVFFLSLIGRLSFLKRKVWDFWLVVMKRKKIVWFKHFLRERRLLDLRFLNIDA